MVARSTLVRYGLTAWGGVVIAMGVLLAIVAPVTGILFVLLGALITPQARDAIADYRGGESLPTIAVVGLAIALLVGAMIAMPPAATEVAPESVAVTDDAASPEQDVTPTTASNPADDPVDAVPTTVPEQATIADPTVVESESQGEPQLSNSEVMAGIESVLEAQQPSATVRAAFVENYIGVLEYESRATSTEELVGEIGTVAGAYAQSTKYNDEVTGLAVYIYGQDGSLSGSYEIDRSWAEANINGDMSNEEYFSRIIETFTPA